MSICLQIYTLFFWTGLNGGYIPEPILASDKGYSIITPWFWKIYMSYTSAWKAEWKWSTRKLLLSHNSTEINRLLLEFMLAEDFYSVLPSHFCLKWSHGNLRWLVFKLEINETERNGVCIAGVCNLGSKMDYEVQKYTYNAVRDVSKMGDCQNR